MGLKSALLGAVVNKTIRTIASRTEVQDSKITVQNKKGQTSPAYDYMSRSSKNCFIFQSGAFDMGSLREYRGKGKFKHPYYFGEYKVFDKSGALKFLAVEKRRGATEKLINKDLDKLYLLDLDDTILGRVNEHIISPEIAIIENNAKTCSVFLEDDKLCNVRRFYSIGKERFKISDGYEIELVKNTDFIIKKGNKKLATIKIFRSNLKELFPRSIVVECDDAKKEKTALLLALAIDTVCSY